jgi:copper chaperone CopZ
VETDLEKQHVTITYDPRKTDVKSLQEGMKNIGYDTKLVSDGPLKEEKPNK